MFVNFSSFFVFSDYYVSYKKSSDKNYCRTAKSSHYQVELIFKVNYQGSVIRIMKS